MSATLAGAPITRCQLSLCARGAWTAQCLLAADAAPTGRVELVLPGISLVGFVKFSGIFAQNVTAYLVGGQAGGVLTEVPGQHYRDADGHLVAQALCAAAGESLAADSDPNALGQQLAHYQVRRMALGSALDELCEALGTDWLITDAGEVRVGPPSWPTAEPAGVVLQREAPEKCALYLALSEEALRAGTTFRGRRLRAVDNVLERSRWRAEAWY